MEKANMIVVSGMPGSGKSTLSKSLGARISMPVISRDEIKEGYIHTLGIPSTDLPDLGNAEATRVYFETLKQLVKNGISIVTEAAFQHRLWSKKLGWFKDNAKLTMIICRVREDVANKRYLSRGLADEKREYFHGDKGVSEYRKGIELEFQPYDEPRIDVPTIYVDTTDGYNPSLKEVVSKLGIHIP